MQQSIISVNEFSTVVQEYAAYKSSIQGCSPKTVQEYLFDLRTFFRYLLARERDIDPLSDAFCQIDVSRVGLEMLEKLRAMPELKGIAILPFSAQTGEGKEAVVAEILKSIE